jgi:hypothetical protein
MFDDFKELLSTFNAQNVKYLIVLKTQPNLFPRLSSA